MTLSGNFSSLRSPSIRSGADRRRSRPHRGPVHGPPRACSRLRQRIDNPIALRLFQGQIAANENGQRRLLAHLRVRIDRGDFRQRAVIVNHDELPWLTVPRTGCAHRRSQEFAPQLFRYRPVFIPADAPPRVNGFQCIHRVSLRSAQFKIAAILSLVERVTGSNPAPCRQ